MTLSLSRCHLCPRCCESNRTRGRLGVCGQSDTVRLARAALHYWEEPPISGLSGSGTVFFSGCPLRCIYCQNAEISNGRIGRTVSVETLARIFLEQQMRGARNINLVTPTHFAPQIVEAVALARSGELRVRPEVAEAVHAAPDAFPYAQPNPTKLGIPIVWNTGGYENPETIAQLASTVDIFLTDFKYADSELAQRYSSAPDYPHAASEALDAMYALVGPCAFETSSIDGKETMKRGIIVRHLMLPGQLADSKAVIDVLATKPYADKLWYSFMSQYTPLPHVSEKFPELSASVDEEEYLDLVDYALDAGLDNSFMQEGASVGESFIPAFDYEGI